LLGYITFKSGGKVILGQGITLYIFLVYFYLYIRVYSAQENNEHILCKLHPARAGLKKNIFQ